MLYPILFVISLIFWASYYWSRRHLYAAARKIKGSPGLPLIGNALSLTGNSEELFEKINCILSQVDNEPIKFWLGPFLLITLKNPEYLEKIMTSSKFAYKHNLYEFVEIFLGNGLISASGLDPIFKLHRKAIQPLFDMKYIENTTEIFQKYTNTCLERLEEHADMQMFNVMDEIHKCTMDFNIDVILGKTADYEDQSCKDFTDGLVDMYALGFERLAKLWLHPDCVYNRLSRGRRSKKIIRDIHAYVEEALIDSWKRRKFCLGGQNEKKFVPIIDRLAEMKELNPTLFNQEDLVDHILTLVAAAEDPVALISAFGVVCFGMYPEYQEKAVEEIRSVIGDDPKSISLNGLYQLQYLDMCIKDLTRLFPAAPLILRRMVEDYQLSKWLIPRGAAIVVSIHNLHRDPQHWTNPNHFHPDHFLPEEVAKRHPYTFLPFSAGPRGCIGKNVANIQLKQFLSSFLLKYKVEADGKLPDLKLKSDISVRSKYGYMCRIRKRDFSRNK